MGTVLTNPYELNFGGLASRNAENIKAAESSTTLMSGETKSTSCNSQYPAQVEIYEQTRAHPNQYNNPNITLTCEGYYYPDNPGSGVRNCGTRYEVKGVNGNVKGTGSPLYIPESDFQGDIFTKGFQQYYSSLVDARMVRDAEVAHWNVFRSVAGCKDSNALNYSPIASTGNCPCESDTPVWTQGQNQSNNPQLQSVAERAGDCSCLMPPTNLDGQGYLVEKWEYVGTPFPEELDSNGVALINQWKWKRNTSKSNLPQSGEDDVLYAIAKPGWRATGLNTPQEFIVKRTLAPNNWEKYRLITATGFEKMGCMDNTAKNYDSEATIDSQDCKFCTDSDNNATIYNQETQKCECIEGYSLKAGLLGSKCKKGAAKSGTNGGNNPKDKDEDEGMSVGTLMAGIAGITVLGLTVLTLSGGKSNE
tara:strand:+ start:3001 stop:4260 length:1260 start_codon:yes stop_codon:yes gene_type:complete